MIGIKQLRLATVQPGVARPHRWVRMGVVAKFFVTVLLIGASGDPLAGESGTPACSDPARLEGHPDPRAPGVFIAFRRGVDPLAAAAILAKRHHFKIANAYSWGTIFSSDLEPVLIPQIRCERDVDYVEFNAVATVSALSVAPAPKNRLERSWVTPGAFSDEISNLVGPAERPCKDARAG
jgi:hypothetical protein